MEKLHVIYSKSKEAIYLSHLDTLRVFTQALSRANIPVAYSNGFNPRPEIAFAHPLSVGIESTGEIFEIILTEYVEPFYFIKEMNKVLPSGLTVLSADYVPIEKKSIMSRVYASTYLITFVYSDELLKGKTQREIEDLKKYYQKNMEKYLAQRNILVLKKSKNRMERIDIKKQILNYEFTFDGSLEITVSSGSSKNLKPSFIMEGFYEYLEDTIAYEVKRTRILYL